MTDPRPRLVLATANTDKATELAAALGERFTVVPRPIDVDDVDETEPTLDGNARLKARAILTATGLPALADDTGLEVVALGGAPGVHSARYAGPLASSGANVDKLLAALIGVKDRRARFRTVVVVAFPGGGEVVADGYVDGQIAMARQGARGFGYDPVFIPDGGGGRTFAEMSAGEKDALGHRGRAIRALLERLTDACPNRDT